MKENDFQIVVDSACDIELRFYQEWGVVCSELTFRFDDAERIYTNAEMPYDQFYDRMRNGQTVKTASANTEELFTLFEQSLRRERDILYLGFSTGLSGTYNAARIAAEMLRVRYPSRKILTVDSLSASAGYGLLLYLMNEKKKTGATIEETAAYAEEMRGRICHWFTVEDLEYLKRGGRINPAVAFVGNVLGFKPILHMDDEGHLIRTGKAHGRRGALAALAERYEALARDPKNGTVFLSHGDCLRDAETLASMLKERFGAEVGMITGIGPVIGAHSGPGTLALFFVGKER